MALLSYCLQTFIKLIVDDQATANKKIIHLRFHGVLKHSIHITEPYLIGIDQDYKFFMTCLFGLFELREDGRSGNLCGYTILNSKLIFE